MLLILLSMIFSPDSALASCRFAEIASKDIHSEKLESILKAWQKKDSSADVSDLVCCLPKAWRSNYLVVPESKSLQCSSSAFPRILLLDPIAGDPAKEPVRAVVSFVGKKEGDTPCNYKFSGANNHDALEIMEFNSSYDPGEMMKLSHLKSSAEREVNPFVCLDCHRTPAGLRPITGERQSYLGYGNEKKNCLTKEERSQQKLWEGNLKKLTLAQKLKPYRCLEPSAVDIEERNKIFFRRISLAQNFQVAGRLRKSPAYQKYKHSFLGAALHCSKLPGFSFQDFLATGGKDSESDVDPIDHRTCKDPSGICGNSIPVECADQNEKTSLAVAEALKQKPGDYGTLLAETIVDQGRDQDFDRAAQFAQMVFLAGKQPAELGLEEALREYSEIASLDFEHFAGLLAEKDPELTALVAQSKKDRPLACQKLRELVLQQRPRELPANGNSSNGSSAL